MLGVERCGHAWACHSTHSCSTRRGSAWRLLRWASANGEILAGGALQLVLYGHGERSECRQPGPRSLYRTGGVGGRGSAVRRRRRRRRTEVQGATQLQGRVQRLREEERGPTRTVCSASARQRVHEEAADRGGRRERERGQDDTTAGPRARGGKRQNNTSLRRPPVAGRVSQAKTQVPQAKAKERGGGARRGTKA